MTRWRLPCPTPPHRQARTPSGKAPAERFAIASLTIPQAADGPQVPGRRADGIGRVRRHGSGTGPTRTCTAGPTRWRDCRRTAAATPTAWPRRALAPLETCETQLTPSSPITSTTTTGGQDGAVSRSCSSSGALGQSASPRVPQAPASTLAMKRSAPTAGHRLTDDVEKVRPKAGRRTARGGRHRAGLGVSVVRPSGDKVPAFVSWGPSSTAYPRWVKSGCEEVWAPVVGHEEEADQGGRPRSLAALQALNGARQRLTITPGQPPRETLVPSSGHPAAGSARP